MKKNNLVGDLNCIVNYNLHNVSKLIINQKNSHGGRNECVGVAS